MYSSSVIFFFARNTVSSLLLARIWRGTQFIRWGDGTSRNAVSLYKFSGTLGPQIIRPWWHNIPALIHPCHYASYNMYRLMQNGRDLSMRGHCVYGTIHFGDQGSQKIRTGTHCFGTHRHPTVYSLPWAKNIFPSLLLAKNNAFPLADIPLCSDLRRWTMRRCPALCATTTALSDRDARVILPWSRRNDSSTSKPILKNEMWKHNRNDIRFIF